jgi:hypothetical protein
MTRNHNISLKLKILINVLAIMSLAYADNTELFNQAMSIGNQNQFNLNLNQSSSIDSYGKSNKFIDDVANNANAGNANAKNMYNGASNDPNYLYNNGTQAIRDCSTQTDPRCTTLNKYGDKDTQTQIQAYTQGLSTRYLISVTPDPSDQACSIVKRKSPVNQSTATCIAGSNQQSQCNNIITPYTEYIPPSPADGTVFNPVGSPGVCGVGVVTDSWIPQSDRAWFIITSNYNMFNAGSLPIVFGATSGVTPCRGGNATVITTPTSSRILIGQFYMDWLGSQRGNIAFYQEPGMNCGVNDSTLTCNINITLAWFNGGVFASWVVNFTRPKPPQYIQHYSYSKGCPDAN